MRPRLIQYLEPYHLGFVVPSYTFMLTLAVIVGALVTLRQARRVGLPPEVSSRAIVHSLLLLFPLARLVFAIQYWKHFEADPWTLLDLRDGRIALYGGMVAVVLGPWISLRGHRRLLLRYLDALAPALCLGLFVGRIGCFMGGCNWGVVSSVPWAVRFPGPDDAYAQHLRARLIQYGDPLSLPVHPTQLYESVFGLAMLVLTSWCIARRYGHRAGSAGAGSAGILPAQAGRGADLAGATGRQDACAPRVCAPSRKRVPVRAGGVFLVAVSAYAVFRFFMEFVRADAFGWKPGAITMAQLVSLLILAVSALVVVKKHGASGWNRAGQKLSDWIPVCKKRDLGARPW